MKTKPLPGFVKKMLTNLFLVVTILLMAIGCKKESGPDPIKLSFDQETLDYILLPLNKTFKYKDSATGGVKTIEVTTSERNTITEQMNILGLVSTYTSEEYHLELKNSGDNSLWFHGDIYAENDPNHPGGGMADINGATVFTYPDLTSTILIEQMEVNGKIYKDVIKAGEPNIYYWAKQYGIIKRTIVTDTSITTELLQ